VGIPEDLTNKLLSGLAGVDYLGSLLKVDAAVESALQNVELEFERSQGQGDLFKGFPTQQVKLSLGEAKATILDKLEWFLTKHSTSGDLGLRLGGEQLAAGVRFVRIAKEESYDIVVGNPPYQGLSKTSAFGYVTKAYSQGKDNLYAAFLERALELAQTGGVTAFLTMRGWMFLGKGELRNNLLRENQLLLLGDVDRGAFEDVPDEVLATVMSIFRRASPTTNCSIALQPTPLEDRSRDAQRTARKRAALLAQVGRSEFDSRGFEVIEGKPIVYWWSRDFLDRYAAAPKLGECAPSRIGLRTSDNARYLRLPWEITGRVVDLRAAVLNDDKPRRWLPYIKGAAGRKWIDPVGAVISWNRAGLAVKVALEHRYSAYPQSSEFYLRPGVAFTMIGTSFSARAHRVPGIIGDMGSSTYPPNTPDCVCLLNSQRAAFVLESLNPTIHFQPGDVARLPMWIIDGAREIFQILETAFAEHESHREPSVEFKYPGKSSWEYTQVWAQEAVDRPENAPLPSYTPNFNPPNVRDVVSFAIGVALGRFGANGEGILEQAPPSALPAGILFIGTEEEDNLNHPACIPLLASWEEHGLAVGEGDDLRTWLRKSFFDDHKKLYENRPIYFPLSSIKKSFVAFVSIHRWKDNTLNVLLADHLVPTKRRLEAEMEDLRTARATGTNKAKAERRFAEVQKLLEELNDFIARVTEIAGQGPPPPDDKTPGREVDARHVMDLDDGVMVNSSALWPLLEPQWKDPKKWWKELASAQGKKDYDWSHLAARYFPTRVRTKCQSDPSLAVAHGCFWALYPAKAYAWELRLQDEIRPDFTIDEAGSDEARERFLADHAREAAEIEAAEKKRRERKAAKGGKEGGAGPLFQEDDEAEEPADE
jgi:hypothetical protein